MTDPARPGHVAIQSCPGFTHDAAYAAMDFVLEGTVNLVLRRDGWDDRHVALELRRGWLVGIETPSYRGFRYPVEIISHGVWRYYRRKTPTNSPGNANGL